MNESKHENSFTHSGFFALRTPLLPFDELLAWGEGLEAPAAVADSARLEQALVRDRQRLRDRLREVVLRAEVREALFVASPDLDERLGDGLGEQLDSWLHQPDSDSDGKLERTLVRYFARMAGRATPFGLFAGCSVGTAGARTRLTIAGRGQYQRHTRLDMEYVVALGEALERQPGLRHALSFRPNSSIYHAAGRWRYAEARRNGTGRSLHFVGIADSDYLQTTLERARHGASLASLATALVEAEPDASLAEAEEYVGELIDHQVLESDLTPPLTGPEPAQTLAERLRGLAGGATAAERLEQVRQDLAALDAAGLGAAPQRYRALARQLEELPAHVELPRLFQVDLVKPAVATLGPEILEEIKRGVAILARLARPHRTDGLARFREAFRARYEGREVPLVEALDEEAGIGFEAEDGPAAAASELLEGLTFPQPVEETATWGRREQLLLGKLTQALAQGADEIALGPRDLDQLAVPDSRPLPDAFAVLAVVAASSEQALDRGAFRIHVPGAFGPSGASLLGRFCHADPTLRRHVEEHLRAEEALQPDAAFAEIVHLSEDGRLGNILCRPVLRGYEIPYLGRSGAGTQRQIPVTDLLVSVIGEQIMLRSARLGRRVVPRLTVAHNFGARAQGVYRFLCGLQGQGRASPLGWDWGVLRDASFLPRVVAGRIVLARACWRATGDELRALAAQRGAERFRAVQAWRASRRLPRWVALADGDNELPVDLDNVLSLETLIELVGNRDQTTLVELFLGPDQLCVRGPEGRFVHELIVPFVRNGEPGARSVECKPLEATAPLTHRPPPFALCSSRSTLRAARSFPPGSEWLYAKLYTGTLTADQVLRSVIRPLADAALGSGASDGWFFIRYGDPEWHLRLRFHGDSRRLQSEVWPALGEAMAPFLHDGRVWRVQLDTYEREVERYGGPEGIVLAERLFQADSEAVLALVEAFPEDARDDARWRLALLGMDGLLADLGFDPDVRRVIIRKAREAFAAEFRADAGLKHQLGNRYRQERGSVAALLDRPDGAWAPAWAILRRRSEQLAPIVAGLRDAERAGRLTLPLADLAPSYVHMHINRLLRSAQREQEYVLYDFLGRHHESLAARKADSRVIARETGLEEVSAR